MNEFERASAYFRAAAGVDVAYAFGSLVAGRGHRESDLDLAVLLDWVAFPDSRARAARQIELLSDLIAVTKRNAIDLVILNDAPPLLARRIVREGQLLHASHAGAVHAFERDTQLKAADVGPFVQRARARLLDALRA